MFWICSNLNSGLQRTQKVLQPALHTRLWSACWCRRYILLFSYAYPGLQKTPAVNRISSFSFSCSELSFGGLHLRCPAVSSGAHIKESVHSNYPFFWQLLKNLTRPYSACIQLLQKFSLKKFPEINGIIYKYNCVKDMFLLYDLCLGNGWGRFWDCCFIHCFKYESQNHEVTLEHCTPVEL